MMKILLNTILITIILCMSLFLTGCKDENITPVITNTIDVNFCISDSGASKSVKGQCLTYYYRGPEDLTLYYTNSWKKGNITMKKFYVTKEKYEIEKKLYPNASKFNDTNLTILVKDYMKVDDMDSYWNEIENSTTYVMVK